MPKTRAHKQESEEKLHGDALDTAVSSAGEHDSQQSSQQRGDERPASSGNHVHDHTKPIGDMRRYEAEREPPQEVSRAGKEYRRQ